MGHHHFERGRARARRLRSQRRPRPAADCITSAAVAAPADTDTEEAGRPSVFNPYSGTDAPPAATKGRKKPFVLDPLLND